MSLASIKKIQKSRGMGAVGFRGEVMLFGGQTEYHMYALSEEGELIADLSDDSLIPGYMCNGTTLVTKRKMYALGFKLKEGKWKINGNAFDGVEWSSL